MKKFLLPTNTNSYKANLHCHTTVSDGIFTPEETKKRYLERGYSIIAFTDHNVLVPHNDLTDQNFLALNGYEIDVTEPYGPDGKPRKVCHLCMVALTPDNFNHVCYHRSKYVFGNALAYRDSLVYDKSLPDYEREYTPECINDIVKKGKDAGFFVTYNHPVWSVEEFTDYSKYRGFDAMEICNFSSAAIGFAEYNPMVYDEMLRACGKLYCVATDDNHKAHDCFGGFTVIRADKLDYATIAKALKQGDFYASQGPEIKDVWYEDGEFHITCAPARSIDFTADYRWAYSFSNSDGSPIEYAHIKLPEFGTFMRATVTDFNGYHANTNAYYIEDMLK